MKKINLLLFIMAMIPISLFAQIDTIVIPSDPGGTEGNINRAIAADSMHLSSKVFLLDAQGYYILNGIVNIPQGQHLTIVGPPTGTTQATAPPMILLSSSITSWRYYFDCFGDITMKNVWLSYANTNGTQTGASLEIEDDTLANQSGKGEIGEFENVIFDYAKVNGSIEVRAAHFKGKFTNCYWRNNIDPHYKYYGRALSAPFGSTTAHYDTVTFTNCTFANMGYVLMQESPVNSDLASFNHCTFLNVMAYPIESAYYYKLSVNNCIFVNTWMIGDRTEGDLVRGSNGIPIGGVLNLDSIRTFRTVLNADTNYTFTFQDGDRHILLTHSSYYEEQWLTDFMATITIPDSMKSVPQPMMSNKTKAFFDTLVDGHKLTAFQYMTRMHLYGDTAYNDPIADPGFILPPTNQTDIQIFLRGRWYDGTNQDWAYNVQQDLDGVWPMNEDLSYTNPTLNTAAMGGYPLGDLYHWYPAQYTTWKAQESVENDTIRKWLTDGIINSVEQNRLGIPMQYELGQNYPNPFNPTTQINYSVPQKGYVTLKVYNLLGQEVMTLFAGDRLAGNYTATLDAHTLTSGVYFYRLQSENTSMTKKLVFLK